MKKVAVIISLVSIVLITSCQIVKNENDSYYSVLKASPEATSFLLDTLNEKKVVFLSEQHDTINPIMFLTSNLEAFHSAGVRYLFLEGLLPLVPEDDDYNFVMIYPWQNAGWKYEEQMLAQAIQNLNATLPEQEKLHVINAEEDLPYPTSNDPETIVQYIQQRDEYAAQTILDVMENTNDNVKAIVFYGGSHGAKKIYFNHKRDDLPAFDWKPLGVYLIDYYQEAFFSFTGISITQQLAEKKQFSEKEWRELQNDNRILFPGRFKGYQIYDNWYGLHDAIIVFPEPLYGVFYQYVPSDANLQVLFQKVRDFHSWLKRNEDSPYYQRNKEQFLAAVYYLKLYFGDLFEYSYWNSEILLSAALEKLEKFAFHQDKNPSEYVQIKQKTFESLRDFHSHMRLSRIEWYQYSNDATLLPEIVSHMEQAQQIFPEDLWVNYWLNMARTQSGHYESALAGWEDFLKNPISRNMSILSEAYKMASECAAELGMADTEKRLLDVRAALVSDL